MFKKSTSSKKTEPAVSKKPVAKTVSTPVRNSVIPKAAPATARKPILEITNEMVAKRAFEIFASGRGGSETDNWFAAERELRQGI